MSPSIVIENPVKIRLKTEVFINVSVVHCVLREIIEISSRTSYQNFDDLVGEFRPRRPFSRFFVSRLYSLDDMETGGFNLLLTLACVHQYEANVTKTDMPSHTIT